MRLHKPHRAHVVFTLGVARSTEPVKFPFVHLAVFTLIAAFWLAFPSPAHAAQQVLKGHVPRATKQLTPIKRLESGAHLDLAIGLPLRNREQLTNLLQDIYNPSSPELSPFSDTQMSLRLRSARAGGLSIGD